MLRYSLGALLGAVVVVSVGCAALTHPTPLWSQFVFTATLILLLSATVAAVVGRSRSFAAGFAIFGWGYLLLTNGPWAIALRPHLLTETALVKLEPLLIDPNASAPPGASFGSGIASGSWDTGGNTVWLSTVANINNGSYLAISPLPADSRVWLRQIGHTLWVIVFAVAGGAVARLAAGKRARAAESENVPAN